jgi:hypothetical protein
MKTLCAIGICAREVLFLRLTFRYFCALGTLCDTPCFYCLNDAIHFKAVGKCAPNCLQLYEVVPYLSRAFTVTRDWRSSLKTDSKKSHDTGPLKGLASVQSGQSATLPPSPDTHRNI